MRRLLAALLFFTLPAVAQEKPDAGESSVDIDFEEPAPEEGRGGEFPYAQPLELIFQNPAFQNGLASSADAINRSVESLMDSLFYSLLDAEKNFYITDNSWFTTSFKRDVYTTPSGAYVVVDRFLLGPRYAKELWRVHNIPVTLGVDGTVEVLQIYLRTDGMRIAEQDTLSTPRRLINNWFGLVPLLSTVLPPSFNQNEMYDPVTELKTPFSFPLDADGFYAMPTGSIRSYAISGGVRFAADFGGLADQGTRELLDKVGGLGGSVPYAIFKRGEHRINVLRHSEHVAWVGLKDTNRTGHSVSPLIGQRYSVLRGALAAKIFSWDWIWKGVPAVVLPVDINVEQAVANLFDQVYEFDLRNPAAVEAYQAAVKGDFVPAHMRYLDKKEKQLDQGVTFHFARTQDRVEDIGRNGPNIAVYKRERQRDHGQAEVEITDPDGKFYVLETSLDVGDKQWDVLVGDEEGRVTQTVEMKVRRVVPKDNPDEPDAYTYAFEADDDPYRLTLGLSLQDRYVATTEYDTMLEELRYFTKLPLDTVPKIAFRDPSLLADRRRLTYFAEPTEVARKLHVTPTYLGRFNAQASLSFSTKQLRKIVEAPEDDLWGAMARAFDVDERRWRDPTVRRSYGHQMQWFGSFFLYPTRLFNIRIAGADVIKEATNFVEQIVRLKTLETPLEMQEAFQKLLDTDYPRVLARALLELTDLAEVPRRVVFSAQPKGSARHEVKTAYGKLNNMVFKAGPPFPEPTRYARAKKKLANFYLDQPREASDRPHITKIKVTTKLIPEAVRAIEEDPDSAEPTTRALDRKMRHVFVTVNVQNLVTDWPAKLYVRVEQAGKIKIGKLELAEKVLELSPIFEPEGTKSGSHTYQFYLTGPLSPLNNFMLNQAVGAGDEFLVTMAVSKDGAAWSDERALEFRFEGGRLTQPK